MQEQPTTSERGPITPAEAVLRTKAIMGDAIGAELRRFTGELRTDASIWRRDAAKLGPSSAALAVLYAEYVEVLAEKLEDLALGVESAKGAA